MGHRPHRPPFVSGEASPKATVSTPDTARRSRVPARAVLRYAGCSTQPAVDAAEAELQILIWAPPGATFAAALPVQPRLLRRNHRWWCRCPLDGGENLAALPRLWHTVQTGLGSQVSWRPPGLQPDAADAAGILTW